MTTKAKLLSVPSKPTPGADAEVTITAPAPEPLEGDAPFAGAFYPEPGNRVEVAAGGPFAEGLKLLAKGVSPLAVDASREALEKQADILARIGHTGPLPTHAVNINLDNLTDPSQVNGLINDLATTLAPQVDEARRGVVSNAQTIENAQELFRRDEGFALRRNVGEAFNAEQVTATRYLMAAQRDKTAALAKAVLSGQNDTTTLLEFRKSLSQMAAVQLQLHGMAAEAGRALQAFKIQATPGLMELGKGGAGSGDAAALMSADTQAFINANGGTQGVVDLAQAFLALPTPAAQNAFARESTRRGVADMVGELWFNFVLSGPATHFVNMSGNAAALGVSTAERAVAAKWGKLFGFVGAKAGVREGEAAAMTQAYWGALGDAWRLANFAFRHGELAGQATGYRMPLSTREVWQMTAQEAQQVTQGAGNQGSALASTSSGKQPAITGENVLGAGADAVNAVSRRLTGRDVVDPSKVGQRGALGRMTDLLSMTIDLAGGVLRTPTRALGAEDQFWRTLAFRGETSARLYREGIAAGLNGSDLRDYVDQGLNFLAPIDEAAGEKFARTVTMNESLTSQIGRGFQQVGASRFGFLFAPFVRVTGNLLNFATQRVAFPVRPVWWKELTSSDPALRDLAMAKASTGALMWMTAYAAASTGYDADEEAPIVVTGAAPQDPALKKLWLQRGYKEYSIRAGGKGGKWVQYSRTDPAGQMLGIAADTVNILSRLDEVTASELGASLIAGIGNNVVNKSFMRTAAEGMEVFTSFDPEQYVRWAQNSMTSFVVPNAVSQITSAQDPYLRKAVGVAEEILKRSSVEGRKSLPLVRDLSGKPVKQEWLFGSRFTGIYASDDKPDPVADEIWRLEMPFSPPDKVVRGVELDDHQYDRLQQLVGYAYKAPTDTVFPGVTLRDGYQIEVDISGLGMWEALGALMRAKGYDKATDGADPPGQKVAMITRLRKFYLEGAEARLLSEYEALVDQAVTVQQKRATAKGADPVEAEESATYYRETLRELANQAKSYEVVE